LAADLIELAMVAIDRRIRKQGLAAAMIPQVHDELLFEGPNGGVDVGSGRNWAEVH